MGRIKTTLIKRITHKLIKDYGEHVQDNFSDNKKVVNKYVETHSKKFRNVIAGYASRLKKKSNNQ